MNLVAAALLIGVYAAVLVHQLTQRGPRVWIVFVVGGVASVLLGVLPVGQAEAALTGNAGVLLFLFGLFLMAADLEGAGALDHLARWLLSKARTARDIPLVLFLGFGLVSSVLVNDALVLLGVPLLFALARRLGAPPKPLLMTLAFAVTVGSVLTPLGNPQNLLVAETSGLAAPTAVFLRYLLIPTVVNLAVGAVLVRRWFGPAMAPFEASFQAVRAERPPLFPPGPWGPRLRSHPALGIFPAAVLALVTADLIADLTGHPTVPVVGIVLAGALGVLLLAPRRVALLRRIDWSVLALFAGLFVVVGGAVQGGVLAAVQSRLPIPSAASHSTATVPLIALTGAGGSQLVSNVPWTALEIPIFHHLGYGGTTPLAWVALAGATTLAGNLTLLGAASNLIVAEEAERRGTHLGLREFTRYGVPLALLTLLVLVTSLLVGL